MFSLAAARWVTVGSLLIKTDPNSSDQAQTRNAQIANKNEHKRTSRNLRENASYFCKTFIHRFDSDRRLQLESNTYRRSFSYRNELLQAKTLIHRFDPDHRHQ